MRPQHVIVRSVLSPHDWSSPTVTAVNSPAGASKREYGSRPFPQHVMVRSVLSPHEWSLPATTALNFMSLNWLSDPGKKFVHPQHVMVWSVLSPHDS